MSLVGKNIDALCSRCGLTLAHVVLYEVAGRVQGVKCKTCGAEHRYRGPAPDRRGSVSAIRRAASLPAVRPRPVRPADAKLWGERNAALPPDAVIWDYRMTERYERGDAISHPRFGRGFVLSAADDGMEVLFAEGRKKMAMNRPETP